MRIVLDTNVIVAALRSTKGASAAVLRSIRQGRGTMLLSTPLLFEYEDVCKRPGMLEATGLEEGDVDAVLDVLTSLAEKVETSYRWRPQLRDPKDELVLEAAVNGRAGDFQCAGFRPRDQTFWHPTDRAKGTSGGNGTMSQTRNPDGKPARAPTFPLRLPTSLRSAVDRLSREEGTSVNQFIAMAVAEKITALATADEFERRAARADFDAFDRIMSRDTPEPENDRDRL